MIWSKLRQLLCMIPKRIAEQEPLVRIIFFPYHINKKNKRLKPAAFRSPPRIDEVSVVRHKYRNGTFCKEKAKKMERAGRSDGINNKEYFGLAVITASEVSSAGSDVRDSRNVFCGHADIIHGYTPIAHEPLPPEITDRLTQIAETARYYPDPSPKAKPWTGGVLK